MKKGKCETKFATMNFLSRSFKTVISKTTQIPETQKLLVKTV